MPPGVAIPPPVAAGGSAADEEDAMPKEDPSKLERAPGEENEEVPTLLDVTLSIITHFPQILTLSPLLVQLFENCPSAKVSIHAPYLMAAILSDTGTFNCGQRERETSYTGCGVCTALNVAPIMGLSAFMRRNVPKQIKLIPDVNKCSRGKEARTETHARVPSLTHEFMISECGVVRRMSELNLVGYPMLS